MSVAGPFSLKEVMPLPAVLPWLQAFLPHQHRPPCGPACELLSPHFSHGRVQTYLSSHRSAIFMEHLSARAGCAEDMVPALKRLTLLCGGCRRDRDFFEIPQVPWPEDRSQLSLRRAFLATRPNPTVSNSTCPGSGCTGLNCVPPTPKKNMLKSSTWYLRRMCTYLRKGSWQT